VTHDRNIYSRLSPIPGEPDCCDVEVNGGLVNFVFHVSRLFLSRRKLDSHVSVEWCVATTSVAPDEVMLPANRLPPTNVDWRSNSSLDTLRKRLQDYYDSDKKSGIPWMSIVQWAAGRVDEFITTVGDLQAATHIEHVKPEYLIQPAWPAGGVTMWYGQGETGKGQLATAAAVCLCAGYNWANLRTKTLGRGLIYVDYEDSYDEFSVRVSRIANALGVPPPPKLRRFDPKGRMFADIADQLKGKIEADGGADGLLVDSAIPAVAGQANDAEPVGALFAAFSWIGLPVLLLGHETKDGGADQAPFGSQIWRTLSRMTVNFQASQEVQKTVEGFWIKDVLLRCTKANNVRRFSPLAFRLTFTDDDSTTSEAHSGALFDRPLAQTWVRQIETSTVSVELHNKLPLKDRLRAFLREQSEPITISDIAKGTGVDGRHIAETFRRNPSLFRSEGGGKGRGNAATWQVIEAKSA